MESKDERLWQWNDLVRFQVNVAERWLKRGISTSDPFAKFFFFFAGFNALYFLWSKIANLKNDKFPDRQPSESFEIMSFVKKFSEEETSKILEEVSKDVAYFANREPPIQSMRERSTTDATKGSESTGRRWQKELKNKSSVKRLVGLSETLYLVRSNLFHGSKIESGDDELVVQHSICSLKVFLENGISLTKRKCPWEW
jgi:hypothetical protein